MNKLFASALIAGAIQALDIKLHAEERPSGTEEDILARAKANGVEFHNHDDDFILGPRFNPNQ